MDTLAVILFALLLLALLAVVGHGLWLVAAAFFRVLVGHDSFGQGKAGVGEELRDLQTAAGVLDRLLASGMVDEVTAQKVHRALSWRRTVLKRDMLGRISTAGPGISQAPPPAEKRTARAPAPVAPVDPPRAPSRDEEILDALPADPVVEVPAPAIVTPAAPASSVPPARVQARPTAAAEQVPVALPPPRPPRRRLRELLAGFMEEKNILWGELAGGLLIVGCSIALVASLWQNLQELPYSPFLVFSAITAGLFGAGEYTLHHWKLQATSRGLLIISLLMIPLNLLVLTLCGSDWLAAGVSGGSLLLAGGVIRKAGRDLIGTDTLPGPIDRRWLLTLALLGGAASVLLLGRTVRLEILTWLPVVWNGAAIAAVLAGLVRAQHRGRVLEQHQAGALLVFVGLASFAAVLVLGFLLIHVPSLRTFPGNLALPAQLLALPLLLAGLLIHQQLPREAAPAAEESREDGPAVSGAVLHVWGTALGLLGLLGMFGSLVLAWPAPFSLLAICLLNGAVLTALAFRCRLPQLHGLAAPCLVSAAVLAAQLPALAGAAVTGTELATTLLSGSSALTLTTGAWVFFALAAGLIRSGAALHGRAYWAVSEGTGLAALVLVTAHGLELPVLAGTVYALCGALALGSSFLSQRRGRADMGLGLLVAASLWGLQACAPGDLQVWALTLAVEVVVLAMGTCLLGRAGLRTATRDVGGLTGVLALVLAVAAPNLLSSSLPTATGGLLTLAALLLAGGTGWGFLTWTGSCLGLAALLHGLGWDLAWAGIPFPALSALLSHAVLTLGGSLLLGRAGRHLAEPLRRSAQVSSLLAVALLFQPEPAGSFVLAGHAAGLALVSLVLAWIEQAPGWIAAFQAGVSLAVVFLVRALLGEEPTWTAFGLYSYGLGLALAGVGWPQARMLLRRWRDAHELAARAWPVDHALLAVLLAGHVLVGLFLIVPGLAVELTAPGLEPGAGGILLSPASGHELQAGLFLAALALALLTALREQAGIGKVLGLFVLILSIPLVPTASWIALHATVVALSWYLATAVLACAVILWLRAALERLGRGLGIILAGEDGKRAVVACHGLVLLAGAGVLLLVTIPAQQVLMGLRGTGPDSATWFARLGMVASGAVPLSLLVAVLIGHALRERSSEFALAAGLLLNLAITGGRALSLVLAGRAGGEIEAVHLVELASLTASLWGLLLAGWDLVHRYLTGARAQLLLAVQVGLGLGSGLLLLAWVVAAEAAPVLPPAWAAEVGAPLGWLMLVTAFAALVAGHLRCGRALSWGWVFVAGLAGTTVLACTLQPWGLGAGTLLVGWPLYAGIWVAACWAGSGSLHARQGGVISLEGLAEYADLLVLPCLVTSWKALVASQDPALLPLAALSMALTTAALAVLALWRRSDPAAFLAVLSASGTVLLLFLHLHPGAWIGSQWVELVQTEVITWAGMTLAWLAARRWLTGWPAAHGVLKVSACIPLLAYTLAAAPPLVLLVLLPQVPLPLSLAASGNGVGWLALILALAAGLLCAVQVLPGLLLLLLGVGGFVAGVLAACTAAPWDTGSWLSFHVLQGSWCVLGLMGAGAGSIAHAFLKAREAAGEETTPSPSWLPVPRDFRPWIELSALSLALLVLRGLFGDPWEPYSAVGVLAVISVQMAVLAFWLQREIHVWASGLLLAVLPLCCWLSWGPFTPVGFLLVAALGLGGAALVWTIIELSPLRRPAQLLPAVSFSAIAGNLALGLVAAAAGLVLTADLAGEVSSAEPGLTLASLLAVAAALVLSLWEPRSRLTLLSLYLLGLVLVAVGVHAAANGPESMVWYGAVGLAAHASVVMALRWLVQQQPELVTWLGLPSRAAPLSESWLVPAQLVVGLVVLLSSMWICLALPELLSRLGGPAAVFLMAVGTCMALLPGQKPLLREMAPLRTLALLLGALAIAELAWAWPSPGHPATWLDRNALLLLALAALMGLYGPVLQRGERQGDWVKTCSSLVPVLIGWALAVLVCLLVQEVAAYDGLTRRTPMGRPEIVAVGAALAILMACALSFALAARPDPFALSERGRTLYVYGIELFLVILFLHLRLNVPELFRGWIGKYWTVIVLLIAYLGVGLGELFERRRLRVLAEPLERTGIFLPLLPLLAFWAHPPEPMLHFAETHAPGMRPMLGYLATLPRSFASYAFLWVLACGLYTLVSVSRRSFRFALTAALAANFALWSLLAEHDIAFASHPQAWLIPLAVILLAAEHINRAQLSAEMAAALRYLGISMIYAASMADLILTGLGQSLWPPVILALLAVAGMLWGILCRIRAFLFLGFSFLVVDVLTMIWHAAVDRYHTWVWWASGIVLGIAILALFTLFEKRRQDVLHLLEDIRRWD